MVRVQTRLALSLVAAIGLCILFYSTPDTTRQATVTQLSNTAHEVAEHIGSPGLPKLPTFPSIQNPFGHSAHKAPPEQANSTVGETSWFNDWKWRNPFSSSVTLDENRAVLPPLKRRFPVYTFYDESAHKDPKVRAAQESLLLLWRRAWWAQGFNPVVLGRPEAVNNPLYVSMQQMKLPPELESDFTKWLAWSTMGTGVFADWRALPMAPYGDDLLSSLRRGIYPQLTSYESLQGALFCGEKMAIDAAIKDALQNKALKDPKSVVDVIPAEKFRVESDGNGVAVYDHVRLATDYKTVADAMSTSESEGLTMLAQLINSHLHLTWQNTFSGGIAILKPLPDHMSKLVEPAIDIARNLSQCSMSPMPSSCPPNRPKCRPCDPLHPPRLTMLPTFRNDSNMFTIGTVPHPYTTTSLHYQRKTLDVPFVRRNTTRDLWLYAVTKEFLGSDIGEQARIVTFKDAVASDWGTSHSLWLTAERESHRDLNWSFGFAIPRDASTADNLEPTAAPSEVRPPPPEPIGPTPNEAELKEEGEMLVKAREAIKSKEKKMVAIRDVVESWNLADTEAWRFARAFSARRRVERLVWEEKEKKYAGAEQREGGLKRWLDI